MEKLGCRKSTLDHRYAQHPFLGSATGYKAKNCFRKKLPTLGTVMKFRDFFVFFFFFFGGESPRVDQWWFKLRISQIDSHSEWRLETWTLRRIFEILRKFQWVSMRLGAWKGCVFFCFFFWVGLCSLLETVVVFSSQNSIHDFHLECSFQVEVIHDTSAIKTTCNYLFLSCKCFCKYQGMQVSNTMYMKTWLHAFRLR